MGTKEFNYKQGDRDRRVTVRTNGHARELVSLAGLPDGVAAREFDYVDADSEDAHSARFVEYLGSWYDTSEFESLGASARSNPPAPWMTGWQSVQTQSAFDCVLLRFPDDGSGPDYGHVILGRAWW